MGVTACLGGKRALAGAILAGLLVTACSGSNHAPNPANVPNADSPADQNPVPHASAKPHRAAATHASQGFKAAIRADLRMAAHRFIHMARGTVDSRLAGPIPVDTPVGLYLGNVRQRTIAAQAITVRQQWNMCVPTYGHSCPVSPLDTIAEMRAQPALSYREDTRCMATLARHLSDLGGSHVVVVQPAKPRSCVSDFAVELWMNDVGQVTSVNLLLGH